MKMKMVIHGKKLSVTPALKKHVETKIGRLIARYDEIIEIDVTLSAENMKTGLNHKVDVLLHLKGTTVRRSAEGLASEDYDLYVAIDEVADVLEIQMSKIKGKRIDNMKNGSLVKDIKYNPETHTIERHTEGTIVTSTVSPRPMNIEEAILQMECLGRAFYTFVNSTTGEMNVVYRRDEGDYGHIEPNK